MDENKIKRLDSAIVLAAKKINVLKTLSWPVTAEEKFLSSWRGKNPQLPEVNLTVPNLKKEVHVLYEISEYCNPNDPVEKFLAETAVSYAYAGEMLMGIGTPDFTKYSCRIYGRPDMKYKSQAFTPVDAAKFFLEITDSLLGNVSIQPTVFDIAAGTFAGWLKAEVEEFFEKDAVEVVLDSQISAKVLAGASRIRIRGSASFSSLDKDQLLYHEAFVHTATQLNGKKQPNLKCLGLAAPRTTRTQEGIAVLAELVMGAMDINRLRRIALRVLAVKMALDGADFIDLFHFFLDAGQTDTESFKSAQRIFRGGAVKDGIVFTKDSVYLEGVLEVHTFLRVAIRDNRPDLIRNIFAGRLTLADALRLSPMFSSGWLLPPIYMPTWASDLRRLSAALAFSAFIANVKLDKVYLERCIELEDELKSLQGANIHNSFN